MEDIFMVKIFASGHSVRLSKKEFKNFKKSMINSRIDFDDAEKKASEMEKKFPGYSEKGYERLRKLGKL